MMREFAGEIDSLKSMLNAQREKNGAYLPWTPKPQCRLSSQLYQRRTRTHALPRLYMYIGVYLPPAEYEQMQAKLAAQTDRIVECEQALRQREEELEEARGAVAGVQARLDAATEALERTEAAMAQRWDGNRLMR